MATEKPRYSITLDDEMFQEVENFRFQHRFPTRNQATIELIRLGLEAIKQGKGSQTPEKSKLNAAHSIDGASEEDKAFDDALMDDDNF